MGDYRLTKYEMETIVNFNAEEETATVYTCDATVKRKMDKLCQTAPDTYKVTKVEQYGTTYSMPKALVTFRAPMVISPERRLAMQENGRRQRQNLA